MRGMYNKHKTHIIYSMNLNSRKFFLIFIMILSLVTLTVTYNFVEKSFQPVVTSLAVSNANTVASKMINDTITDITGGNIDYSKLCTANKNENGDIISISANAEQINKIKLELTEKLIQSINNSTIQEVGIPTGNLTKSHILSGRGPIIPVKLLITGSPKINFDNKFESAGINQTKHTISIITTVEIEVILPYDNVKTSISSETMLCETIIVGNIPDVYVSR